MKRFWIMPLLFFSWAAAGQQPSRRVIESSAPPARKTLLLNGNGANTETLWRDAKGLTWSYDKVADTWILQDKTLSKSAFPSPFTAATPTTGAMQVQKVTATGDSAEYTVKKGKYYRQTPFYTESPPPPTEGAYIDNTEALWISATSAGLEKSIYSNNGWQPVGAVIVADIKDLISYNGSARVLNVLDSDRGGFFFLTPSKEAAVDSGVVFPSSVKGYLWKRKFDGPVNIKWFGAKGDSFSDDGVAYKRAVQKYRNIYFPNGVYLFNSGAVIPDSVSIAGENREAAIIKKAFNGDLFSDLGESAALQNITVDGSGNMFSGRSFLVNGRKGRQSFVNCNIVNSENYAVEFTTNMSGSQSFFSNCKIYRHNGLTNDRFAIKIKDSLILEATPKKFTGIETNGYKFIDFGGCSDFFIENSFIGDMKFSNNSRGICITNSRVGANVAVLNIRGFNHSISGCNIAPKIILNPGVGEVSISANTYNLNPPVIDNSGNGSRNMVMTPNVLYAPVWTSGKIQPDIGNGTLIGSYVRQGAFVSVAIKLIAGTTTKFGVGDLRFSLPVHSTMTGSFDQIGYALLKRNGTVNDVIPMIVFQNASDTFVRLVATKAIQNKQYRASFAPAVFERDCSAGAAPGYDVFVKDDFTSLNANSKDFEVYINGIKYEYENSPGANTGLTWKFSGTTIIPSNGMNKVPFTQIYIKKFFNGVGYMTYNTPVTFKTGDEIAIQFSYNL